MHIPSNVAKTVSNSVSRQKDIFPSQNKELVAPEGTMPI